MNLRQKLIRLAYIKPQLRGHLLPLLNVTASAPWGTPKKFPRLSAVMNSLFLKYLEQASWGEPSPFPKPRMALQRLDGILLAVIKKAEHRGLGVAGLPKVLAEDLELFLATIAYVAASFGKEDIEPSSFRSAGANNHKLLAEMDRIYVDALEVVPDVDKALLSGKAYGYYKEVMKFAEVFLKMALDGKISGLSGMPEVFVQHFGMLVETLAGSSYLGEKRF